MDGNNLKPTQDSPYMVTNSWRTQQHIRGIRQKMISNIIEVLKEHSPPEDHTKVKEVASSYEQRTFTASTSQEEYVQRIVRKLSATKAGVKNGSLHSLPSVQPSAPEYPGAQGSRCPQNQLCKPEQPYNNPVASKSRECGQLSTHYTFNNTTPSSSPLAWSNRPNQKQQYQINDQKVNVTASLPTQQSINHGTVAIQPSLMQNKSLSVDPIHSQSQQLPSVQMGKSPFDQPTLSQQKQLQLIGRVEGQQHFLDVKRTKIHQMSRQSKISGYLGTQSGNFGIGSFQSNIMKQQPVVSLQQQAVQTITPTSLPTHGKQSQPESNAQSFVFQAQSPPTQEEIKQAVPMSNSLSEAHRLILQRKQFLQSQNNFVAESANLKLDRGQVDVDTWREEIYQQLQTLKKFFLPGLKQMCYKLDANLRQITSAPQPLITEENEKQYKTMLHCLKKHIVLLEMARHNVEPNRKQHFAKLEKDIIHLFKSQEEKRSMSSQNQKQLPQPTMNPFQQSSPYSHNRNPLQSDTNMHQSLHLKQRGMTKSHLGEQQYPQGNVKQQLATQKRQREIENIEQPLNFQAHQNSGSLINLTEVMNVKKEIGHRGTPMQHHFSRQQQQVKPEPPSFHVSSTQLLKLPSIQNPSPRKKQESLQTSPKKIGTSNGVQQESAVTPLQIATPGLSVSSLLESSNNNDCNHQESNVIEQPIQRLLRVVKSMSPATLVASVEDMITGYHSEDIFPPADFLTRGGNFDSSVFEVESVATSTFPERTMIKAGVEPKDNNPLMEEIRTINRRLMSTIVEICDENDDSNTATFSTKEGQAKIVKCTFIDLATRHYSVSSEHESENLWPFQPLKLLIPGNYPSQSPLVLDKLSTLARDGVGDRSMNEEDLTEKAISKLNLHLRNFEQPLSLEKIAKAWDACAHGVFREFAEQHGGGSFSSRYGVWEKCASSS